MFAAYFSIGCFTILLKTSYLNREIFVQMRFLIRRREIYSRLVRDPQMLRCNPTLITNRIQQIAV